MRTLAQLCHSMARANLNKSKKVLTFTTAASKYIPRRPRISINRNPPFQTSLHKISKVFFFRLKKFFFRNKKNFFQEQLLFSFFMYWKAKKKIGAIQNFLKNFVFQKTLSKFWKIKILKIFQISPNFFFRFSIHKKTEQKLFLGQNVFVPKRKIR